MDSLMKSVMRKDVTPQKLSGLSPEKYGKSAWAELTYTPNKLADNVLFREVTTMRRQEESSSKLREYEALNGFNQEKLRQLEIERDGIQKSLSQQVDMYKTMLRDAEAKHESRLKDIQRRFSDEITVLIQQREEEAKYAQAQKEVLENRVAELENDLRHAEAREAELTGHHTDLGGQHQKLQEEHRLLGETLKSKEKKAVEEAKSAQEKLEEVQRNLVQTETTYKQRIENMNSERKRENDQFERLMKIELEKVDNLRVTENLKKAQQTREVMIAFENETKRLNEIIAMKDRMIQSMALEGARGKEDLIDITKSYEAKISQLSQEHSGLQADLQRKSDEIRELSHQLELEVQGRRADKEDMSGCIARMREELQLNQVNMVREKDKYQYWGADLEKQIAFLRGESNKMAQVGAERDQLTSQMRNMRDLLVESSFQIEQSKQQIIRISFDRDNMAAKLNQLAEDNEKLYQLKHQLQKELLQWRGSFYNQQRAIYHP